MPKLPRQPYQASRAQAALSAAILAGLIFAIEAWVSSGYHGWSALYVFAWVSSLIALGASLSSSLDAALASKRVELSPLKPTALLALLPTAYALIWLVDGGVALTLPNLLAMLSPPALTLTLPALLKRPWMSGLASRLLDQRSQPHLEGPSWWLELKWGAPLWLAWAAMHHAEGTLLVVRKGSELLHVGLYVGTALITSALVTLLTAAQRPELDEAQRQELAPRAPLCALLALSGLGLIYVDQTALVGLYESVHLWLWWSGFSALGVALIASAQLSLSARPTRLTRPLSLIIIAALSLCSIWGVSALSSAPRLKSYVSRSAFGEHWLELYQGQIAPWLSPHRQTQRDPNADHPALHFDQRLTAAVPEGLKRPHILLISIDALRGDYVRPGRKNSPTPFISELAKQNAYFKRAYATGTRTAIGMTGVHFGRYSRETQWETWLYKSGKIYPPQSKTAAKIRKRGLKHVYTTIPKDPPGGRIAERLKRAGYRTVAAPYAGHNDFFRPGVGFDKGFDHFHDLSEVKWPRKSGERVTKAALSGLDEALKAREGQEPLFMWAHYYDPHESRRSLKRYRSLTRYMDTAVKALVEGFKERGLLEDTLIIITADHGEAFKEHGFSAHGTSVYEAQTHVPLVIALPKRFRRDVTVKTPVSHVDIAATIAVAAGADTQALSGLNLLPSLLGEETPPRAVFSELHRYRSSKRKLSSDLSALWQGDWKLIIDHKKGTSALYNVRRDPRERRDLAELDKTRFDAMYELSMIYRRRGYPLH